MRRARNDEVKYQQKVSMAFRFKILAITGRDPEWIEYCHLSFKEIGAPSVAVLARDTEPFAPIPQGCGCECAGCSDQGWHCHKTDKDCYV